MRIHSQTGAREASFEEGAALQVSLISDVSQEGGDLPMSTSISSLIGTTLRVYKTGDAVTDEYLLDRTNIELDPTTRRIVRIRAG